MRVAYADLLSSKITWAYCAERVLISSLTSVPVKVFSNCSISEADNMVTRMCKTCGSIISFAIFHTILEKLIAPLSTCHIYVCLLQYTWRVLMSTLIWRLCLLVTWIECVEITQPAEWNLSRSLHHSKNSVSTTFVTMTPQWCNKSWIRTKPELTASSPRKPMVKTVFVVWSP